MKENGAHATFLTMEKKKKGRPRKVNPGKMMDCWVLHVRWLFVGTQERRKEKTLILRVRERIYYRLSILSANILSAKDILSAKGILSAKEKICR
jgi:hypothetical protein